MSDKVVLPKEIATYIEDLLIGGNNEMLLAGILGNANSPKYIAVRKHFEKDFDLLLKAIVNGYEIEYPNEERAIQWLMEQDIISRQTATRIVQSIKTILEGGQIYA
jgi:hypothetical protein